MFNNFPQQLFDNIIKDGRWQWYLGGLGNTLLMTLGATMIGIIIGCLIAICKVTVSNRKLSKIGNKVTFADVLWKIVDVICDIYLTIVRGMPSVVLLMIFVYIIFQSVSISASIYIAMFAFGINSGAYVAEIIRSGIMAVDKGQTEAGRSLGLSSATTMSKIVLPQAIKNVLPALFNEGIVLLKETSIAGYVAIADLTYQATLIRSRTFSPVPLLVIAIIYIIIVTILSAILRKIERRLSRSDNR